MLEMNESATADVATYMAKLGSRARAASFGIAKAATAQKNAALLAIAQNIDARRDELMAANQD